MRHRVPFVWLPGFACVAVALVTLVALAAPQEPGGRSEAEYSPLGYYDLRAYEQAYPGVPGSASVTQVIAGNLQRSGLFAPIDQAAYIERIHAITATITERRKRLSSRAPSVSEGYRLRDSTT